MKSPTLFAGLVVFLFSGICFAQEEPVKPAEPEVKQEAAQPGPAEQEPAAKPKRLKEPVLQEGKIQEIQGEVSSITKNSISVVTFRDEGKGEETEMVLPFDARKVLLERIRSLDKIQPGDTVLVRYREDILDYGDTQKGKAAVVTIRFVKTANDKSFYKNKPTSTGSEALVSGDLSLKGVK
jgi:hypothetical protein